MAEPTQDELDAQIESEFDEALAAQIDEDAAANEANAANATGWR